MSNTEMVSVPREVIQYLLDGGYCSLEKIEDLRELLAQPAEQHQVELVALPARRRVRPETPMANLSHIKGWNACLDEIAKLGPLYTHAGPGEVDRLREENALLRHDIASYLETMAKTCDLLGIDTESAKNAEGKPSDVLFKHAQELRAQLAERGALLREARSIPLIPDLSRRIDAALSASAEPSEPVEQLQAHDCGGVWPVKDFVEVGGCPKCGPDAPVERDDLDVLRELMVGYLPMVERIPLAKAIKAAGFARTALEIKQ